MSRKKINPDQIGFIIHRRYHHRDRILAKGRQDEVRGQWKLPEPSGGVLEEAPGGSPDEEQTPPAPAPPASSIGRGKGFWKLPLPPLPPERKRPPAEDQSFPRGPARRCERGESRRREETGRLLLEGRRRRPPGAGWGTRGAIWERRRAPQVPADGQDPPGGRGARSARW